MTSWLLAMALAGPARAAEVTAGINVLAPLPAVLPVPASTLTSILSNLETGLAVSGGTALDERWRGGLRASFGPNSRAEWLLGLQTRLSWAPFPARTAFTAGGGVRYWDLGNRLTGVQRHNLAVDLAVGRRWERGRFYVDLEGHEILAVTTWTSEPHTEAGVGTLLDPWLPKVPLLSLDFGWTFVPGEN